MHDPNGSGFGRCGCASRFVKSEMAFRHSAMPVLSECFEKRNRAARAAAVYFVDIASTEFHKFDLCEDGDFYVGQNLLSHLNMIGTRKAFK